MSEFDFSKVTAPVKISKEWILKQLDDSLILNYYFGPFRLNKAYCSIFDKGDKKPSTMFYQGNNGRIIFYDFRDNSKLDVFGFVMKMFNISFKEALELICQDFGLIDTSTLVVPQKVFKQAAIADNVTKKETLIQFEPDKWNSENLRYWRQYEITQEELVRDKVYAVKRLYLNHMEIKNPLNELRFAYPIEGVGVKIYCPNSLEMKHLTNIPLSVPFGIDELPYTDDKVIITKSKKDRLVLLKFFTDVIATQNESTGALPEEVQTLLKRRYSQRIVMFDNDDVGVKNSIKLNFGYFNIPREEYERYRIKDPSDFVKAYGTIAFESLLKTKNLL